MTVRGIGVVTAMALPLIDLIVPTAFTLDFGAVVCWVPSFCAATRCGAATKAAKTTATEAIRTATGLRVGVMVGISG